MTRSGLFKSFDVFSKSTIFDFAERLNSRYTVFILAMAIAVVAPNNYIDTRITCFSATTPNQKSTFSELFENYCYTNGTIVFLPEDATPITRSEWDKMSEKRKINYYQWFSVILILQLALFKIPSRIWNYFSMSQTNINLDQLIQNAEKIKQVIDANNYTKAINNVANEIDRILFDFENRYNRQTFFSQMKKRLANILSLNGKKLTLLYMFVKFIFTINVIGQLAVMCVFMFNFQLFPTYNFFNRPGQIDLIFPRNVLCYLPNIIGTETTNSYMGQCILHLNMFNQFAYILIHYWFFFVAIIELLSFPFFIHKTFIFRTQFDFIKHLLKVSNLYSSTDKNVVKKFIRNHLGCDGVFLIRKLNDNVNHFVASDIVTVMFDNYKSSSVMFSSDEQ